MSHPDPRLLDLDLDSLVSHVRFCSTCQEAHGRMDLSPASDAQIDMARIVPPSPSVALEWEIVTYDNWLIKEDIELPSEGYDPSPEARNFMARRRVAEEVRREIEKIRSENPEITFCTGAIPMKIITHSRSLLKARLRVADLRDEFECVSRLGVEV